MLYVASKLYEDGLVTAGQAAEITGLSKRSFIEVLGRYGVSLFSLSTEDLIRDVNNEALIIADASCLIALTNIDALWILQSVYKKVFITETVLLEYEQEIPDFIEVKPVHNHDVYKVLKSILDPGEASAIALGMENAHSLLILDDL